MRLPKLVLLALLLGSIAGPARADYETVALINQTTDAFTLSVNGGPTCSASPRNACIRSARTGRNEIEACSSKECFKKTIELADREVLRWTISETRGKYEQEEERRMQRP